MPRVAFLEDAAALSPVWLCGQELVEVLQTERLDEVVATLAAVERAAKGGLYAAGFVSYEAAAAFDSALVTHPGDTLPLVWFALFREMVREEDTGGPENSAFSAGPWQPSLTPAAYDEAIARIKQYIAAGDTYQVNFTFRLRAAFQGDPWQFFRWLNRGRAARYAAYVDTGRHVLCSASPELFFSLDGEQLLSLPMKGTAPRGLTQAADVAARAALAASVKDRAENAMIVDMVRNDLGRIARRGSVHVVSAFDVETYPTVLQMTSRVAGETAASLAEIFRALFPAASITGAPKVRTMQIIRELEPERRGIYTGAIGYLGPRRQARFNVAIRTAMIDRTRGEAEYGVGGGIVWDSTAAAERAECDTKAAILTAELPTFDLLETLLYEEGEYFLLPRHLARLTASAAYFDYPLRMEELRARLADFARSLEAGPQRVRLRVARDGQIAMDAAPRGETPVPWRLRLSPRPIDQRNVFLYHKTTARAVYDAAYAQRGDADDVLLWNEQGQVTETTIANVVLRRGGRWVTPPVSCGLLGGVFREHLLAQGEIYEDVVTLEELGRADGLACINAVRKWMPAQIRA